ncbi:hypothetical protein GCM10011531_06490 [Aquaticitalea lipolytica]|uniref:Uncharacterized protein n=1 Tax=Aquaticitalea lipolytica TaxID=1247562 RepID=A0A8J2TMP2_9FLAO|nr:DUF6498-containing protein [Aquaticitalea lipolytica]GFZ79399.1 hypothetical protein GCM10011531_06490 [Aquaticitalea lipolytica]
MLQSVFIPNKNNSYAWMNLIVLIVLLFLGKIEPYAVLFGYFLETIIIGLFNAIKMYVASRHDGSGKSVMFFIPFFLFHYGAFVAIQSIFVFVIFGIGDYGFFKEPFYLIENYKTILHFKGMEYILPLMVGTQLMKFIFDFILPQKQLQFTVQEIMYKPYARIFIQQFTVILAMFFMMFTSVTYIAALLLIFFRAIVDFSLVSIKDNAQFLNYLVDKLYDGKTSKEELKKQLLLFSE